MAFSAAFFLVFFRAASVFDALFAALAFLATFLIEPFFLVQNIAD
jgi:hypothetical protein